MTTFLIILIISTYLISSIPSGLLLTKLFLKTDIRKIGSGNIGATNVLRTGSKWIALATLLLDALKSILSLVIAMWFIYLFNDIKEPFFIYLGVMFNFILHPIVIAAVILFSVLGHMFPLYLKFKGGKGVATTFGSLFLITKWYNVFGLSLPILPLAALFTWILVAVISKKSSLSALVASIASMLYIPFMLNERNVEFWGGAATQNVIIFMSVYFVIVLLIFYKHKENIKRLLNGTESSISFKKSAVKTENKTEKKVAVKKIATKPAKAKTTKPAKNAKPAVKKKK